MGAVSGAVLVSTAGVGTTTSVAGGGVAVGGSLVGEGVSVGARTGAEVAVAVAVTVGSGVSVGEDVSVGGTTTGIEVGGSAVAVGGKGVGVGGNGVAVLVGVSVGGAGVKVGVAGAIMRANCIRSAYNGPASLGRVPVCWLMIVLCKLITNRISKTVTPTRSTKTQLSRNDFINQFSPAVQSEEACCLKGRTPPSRVRSRVYQLLTARPLIYQLGLIGDPSRSAVFREDEWIKVKSVGQKGIQTRTVGAQIDKVT